MSFLDSSRPRSVPWFFYSSALLSAILFSAASYASVSYHRPLLVLALVTALAAAFFLVLFLRSRDERERQINYRATFAFVGTRVFSLGLPAVMMVPWSFGLILYSWRDRGRLGCACFVLRKNGRKPNWRLMSESLEGPSTLLKLASTIRGSCLLFRSRV